MGYTSYSDDFYHARAVNRASTGTSAFAHTDSISKGQSAAAVHQNLNPLGVKMRESRDSTDHPTSKSIVVAFDVTGSMRNNPMIMQKKLPELMALLIKKGYVEHPQIMFVGIGDAFTDQAPLQVGQFESGLEMEDDLGNIYLEGNGGGQRRESYELAMYFLANHTSMDCLEKRGERGYLIIVGDENYYPVVTREQVSSIIGDKLEADIPTEEVFKQLSEKFEVFLIRPTNSQHGHDKEIPRSWSKLVGENIASIDDANNICEAIAATIGIAEGKVDIDGLKKDLVDIGTSAGNADAITNALAPVAKNRNLSKPVPASKELVGSGADGIDRL